ncbi:hypothetical protein Aduo_003938 [Ancylostoma duodenale]
MDRIILLGLAVYSKMVDGATDATFKRFCNTPANFGTGNLIEENTCQLTYKVVTEDETAAFNFCDRQHPFTLLSATKDGPTTTCRIRTYYMCKGSDALIGNKCLIPRVAVEYAKAKESCGRDYSFYTVANGFEQKWIAAFFTNYKIMWIANTKSQLKHLKYALFEGETLHNQEARLVSGESEALAILASKGAKAGLTVGTITSVSPETQLHVLCYREAEQLDTYFTALVERMGNAGLSSRVYTDAHGEKRNFLIVRSLLSFELNKDEYGAGTNRLHNTCKGFLKGYAASPLDFKNLNDFKELLRKEDVNIVAIPGRKIGSKLKNMGTCDKDPGFKLLRNQYYIDLPDGKQKIVRSHHWQDTMPDRTCADTPRTALGFSQKGVVDIPAVARHFVVCTYGRPYHSDTSGEEHTCHRFAYYDKNQCRCRNEGDDIRVTKLFPITEMEKSLKPGTQCLDCTGRQDHDIIVIFDCSDHVKDFGMYKTLYKNFLLSFAAHKSRTSVFVFGDKDRLYMRRNRAYKVDDDFEAIVNTEIGSWKNDLRHPTGVGGTMFSAVGAAVSDFEWIANNKKLLILVVAGKQSDTKQTVDTLNQVRA